MTEPVTVVLVRHADVDVPARSADPSLNARGRRRAQALAQVVGSAGVSAVFTSELTRTMQTVAPLIVRLGLRPAVVPPPAVLAEQVRSGALGAVVLVAGHSNTVPEMIKALGAGPEPVIGEREFDNLFVVTAAGSGPAGLLRLRY